MTAICRMFPKRVINEFTVKNKEGLYVLKYFIDSNDFKDTVEGTNIPLDNFLSSDELIPYKENVISTVPENPISSITDKPREYKNELDKEQQEQYVVKTSSSSYHRSYFIFMPDRWQEKELTPINPYWVTNVKPKKVYPKPRLCKIPYNSKYIIGSLGDIASRELILLPQPDNINDMPCNPMKSSLCTDRFMLDTFFDALDNLGFSMRDWLYPSSSNKADRRRYNFPTLGWTMIELRYSLTLSKEKSQPIFFLVNPFNLDLMERIMDTLFQFHADKENADSNIQSLTIHPFGYITGSDDGRTNFIVNCHGYLRDFGIKGFNDYAILKNIPDVAPIHFYDGQAYNLVRSQYIQSLPPDDDNLDDGNLKQMVRHFVLSIPHTILYNLSFFNARDNQYANERMKRLHVTNSIVKLEEPPLVLSYNNFYSLVIPSKAIYPVSISSLEQEIIHNPHNPKLDKDKIHLITE